MVTKVKNIRLPKFQNGDHVGFHLEVQIFVNKAGAENISCTDELPLYNAAVLAEVDIVNRQRGSALTADLDQLDLDRDELVAYLFSLYDGAKISPFAGAKEAHRQLTPVMKAYRGIGSHTNVKEGGEIVGILKDLRMAALSEYITTLVFAPVMDLLEAKNNAYMDLDNQRAANMPSKLVTDTLRGNVDKCYNNIVDKINATVILTPNAAAETLVKGLNNYIDQMNASYNLRMAHTKKAVATCEEVQSETCTNENCEEHGSSEAE